MIAVDEGDTNMPETSLLSCVDQAASLLPISELIMCLCS